MKTYSDNINSINHSGKYSAGLEIGTVSVKWSQRMENDNVNTVILRHGGHPEKIVRELLSNYNAGNGQYAIVTGQASNFQIDLPYRSETECLEKSLAHYDLQPDILLSLGGETFILYTMLDGTIKNIITSSKCAAGTGEFVVQQFQRMGLTLEEGINASENGKKMKLATRCSVHCKSDATHKLNKGECTPADIAKSLVDNLAEKVSKMIDLSKWPSNRIVVAGGVAENKPFIENLRALQGDSEIIVLNESPFLEAFGASLFASEISKDSPESYGSKKYSGIDYANEVQVQLSEFDYLLDYRVQDDTEKEIVPGASYILAVDAGSTTTKAVLLNASDFKVGASCYLRTLGNPVEATKNCLKELTEQVGEKQINIIQAAATGSGREVVSVYLDNCLSFNEILAHARAAADVVDDVDTVFEIGGQDSKFISFLDGVPIDYAMNDGCSAGTGSFLEESISVDLGISVKDISDRAINSRKPVRFGERCAAFINTDLRSALLQGAGRDDVISGLVYSIAENYISRIVGQRSVGDTVLFQGGVALNKSVALAIAAKIYRKIIVPPNPELMGCVGSALMAIDSLDKGTSEKRSYELDKLMQGSIKVKSTFQCKSCSNLCEIQNISVREETYPFGGLCSKFEVKRHGDNSMNEGRDLVEVRNKLMFEEFGPETIVSPRGTIGLPMALTSYEIFPFYAKLINEMGYNVVLSEESKIGNTKTNAPICYPCEMMHGAVYDLINKKVDYILLPYLIEFSNDDIHRHSYTCPSTVNTPDLIKAAFNDVADMFLTPHLGFSSHLLKTTLYEIGNMGKILGLKRRTAVKAGKRAFEHYQNFRKKYAEIGSEILSEIISEPTVIIAGRPYITCSSDANLALPRKIASRGYNVIPADMLPMLKDYKYTMDVWHFTHQVMNSALYAKKYPNLYICLISCFSCMTDASMYHMVREQLAGNTFCYLEIDSHTAHAGFDTRIGAFLDLVEDRRREEKPVSVIKTADTSGKKEGNTNG